MPASVGGIMTPKKMLSFFNGQDTVCMISESNEIQSETSSPCNSESSQVIELWQCSPHSTSNKSSPNFKDDLSPDEPRHFVRNVRLPFRCRAFPNSSHARRVWCAFAGLTAVDPVNPARLRCRRLGSKSHSTNDNLTSSCTETSSSVAPIMK